MFKLLKLLIEFLAELFKTSGNDSKEIAKNVPKKAATVIFIVRAVSSLLLVQIVVITILVLLVYIILRSF